MVPNGVDPGDWGPGPPAGRRGSEQPLVVAWGRVQYEKGFQTLVHALPDAAPGRARRPGRHRRAGLLPGRAAGHGPGGGGGRHRATSPASSPTTSCKHLLHEARCAVIPRFYEPFGIVALEAMAAGAPVVAAASGGLIEVIDGTGAGLLYPPGDTGALERHAATGARPTRRAGRAAGDGLRPARAALHVGQGGRGHDARLRDSHGPCRSLSHRADPRSRPWVDP